MTEPTPAPAPQPAPRPEPVLTAAKQSAAIVALVAAVATALGAYGVTTGQQWAQAAAAIVTAITTGMGYALPRITAQGARAQVTPLAAPESVDGTPLVAARDVSPNMGPDAGK